MADDLGGPRPRRPEGGPRRSGSRALVFWMVALIAGGAAAVLLQRYLETASRPAGPPVAKLVVAKVDLPIATTLRPEHLDAVDWPDTARPPGSIQEPKDVVGRVLLARVVKGEPILLVKIASKEAGNGLAALIPESMRAVSVRVDDVVGVAGFIHPDDRVDVIVTLTPMKPEGSEPTSKMILQNVKVLAVGTELEVKDGNRSKPLPVTVATLLVSPDESEKLALAATQGRLLLTLRSWTDSGEVPTPGIVPSALLAGGQESQPSAAELALRRLRLARRAAPAPAAAPPPPAREVVEILRGDRFEKRNFEAKATQ